jgi:transcriptional regulator with XRE-family HTH domain
MASREGPAARGRRRARELLVDMGREARNARLGAGLSQRSVAKAAATSSSSVSRIERGRAPCVSIERVATVLAVVGLDLGARAYPAGPPIRDVAHLRLLARFRARIGPGWRWRPEVPIGGTGDLRAWDGVLVRDGQAVAIEAETRLHDVQALLRRVAAKRRDGGAGRLVLVVADTRTNREVVRAARPEFVAVFPADARSIWPALVAGLPPPDDALVLV